MDEEEKIIQFQLNPGGFFSGVPIAFLVLTNKGRIFYQAAAGDFEWKEMEDYPPFSKK